MKKEKRSLYRTIATGIDLPNEMSLSASEVSVIANREVTVEHCRGILLYETDEIHLRLPGLILRIGGSGLTLKTYFGSHVSVKGRIASLEFDDDKDR